MKPSGREPPERGDGEPLPAPPAEGDAAPERASLLVLFGAAAIALALVLGAVALLAVIALRP